ncbi:MAG TPA: class I SAM-dependent methyltransferase [Streptosporangiaceae bacterium]
MRLGFAMRAANMMLRHPREGIERVRGRIDTRQDKRELATLGCPQSEHYAVVEDWAPVLHKAIDAPWPCQEPERFGRVWEATVSGLTAAGLRVGLASYRGWNDGDRAQAEAIWCLVAHLRPANVVETGVAHGLTSRVILEGLHRNGHGHLWSVDLPAVDPALHHEIGVAVPEDLRSRWTYVEGTSLRRLPGLVRRLQRIDLFVHDSLHTARNTCFELGTVWPVLPPGGVAVVDDIHRSLGFSRFIERAAPGAWVATRHVAGDGLWGAAIKARLEPGSGSGAQIRRPRGTVQLVRDHRHDRIQDSVVGEIAHMIKALARDKSHLLQIQPCPSQSRQTLIFSDQLTAPCRPVIYDAEDRRDPAVSGETDFRQVDIETAAFPADDGEFDLVIWNGDLVTVKGLGPALREARRVLRPGGVFVVAIPNLAALHNRLLLLTGRQPTALPIDHGDHIRGFAGPAMTGFLTRDLDFELLRVSGVGLAPVSAAVVPGPLRSISHTFVWALRK